MSLPFAEVYFASTGARVLPERLEVVREAFRHEVAVVRVSDAMRSEVRLPSGSAVVIAWGDYPRVKETFFGYVHHSEPFYDEEFSRPAADIVCVGMSAASSAPQSRSWMNTRVDLLAQQIADETRMLAKTEPHERVLSNVTQGGVSSWKFLVDKAKDAGLVLYARGPRIYLRDRDRVLHEFGHYAPTVTRGMAHRLRAVVGELNPSEREAARREGYGIGPSGLVAYSSRAKGSDLRKAERPRPAIERIVTGFGADDARDIEHVIEAEEREGAYVYEAEVELPLMPRLGVCSPLALTGFGSRYDGFWSANRVKFTFDESGRRTEVRMVKSTMTDPLVRPHKTGLRPRPTYPDNLNERARLVDGSWVAEVAA